MAHGQGKWRIRWRQWEEQPDGTKKRKSREVMAYSVEERKRLEVEIEKALATVGFWSKEQAPAKPAELNLEAIADGWIQW